MEIKRLSISNPQTQAWGTRRKNEAIEAYKAATSAGIKAGVNRQFKKDFGTDLKDLLSQPIKEEKKKRAVKPATTKEIFSQKEIDYMIPKCYRDIFDSQNLRIAELEKKVVKLLELSN